MAIVLLGPSGLDVARRIAAALPGSELYGPSARFPAHSEIVRYQDFPSALRDLFTAGRAIVALCSSGIVIRILAPLLDDKWAEPPVVAVAEDGSAVVPLLGGHRGANRLAVRIAEVLGCPAAITTAGMRASSWRSTIRRRAGTSEPRDRQSDHERAASGRRRRTALSRPRARPG